MATGSENYQRAEELLDAVVNEHGDVAPAEPVITSYLMAAQAHATLALAAAIAMSAATGGIPAEDFAAWNKVAGEPRFAPRPSGGRRRG